MVTGSRNWEDHQVYCSSHFSLSNNCYALAAVLIMNIVTSNPPKHPTSG